MENNTYKWYIVNVMAGQENKVGANIESMIIRENLSNFITEVLVPTKPVIKIKKGQRVQEDQKLFPGYVFINSTLGGDVYNLVNSIPKVMGFLGSKNSPQAVADEKMEDILNLSSEQASDTSNIMFEVGETLNVIEGPFESFSGTVEDFDAEKQKVKISVLIFGRATSVELEINQVEKIL